MIISVCFLSFFFFFFVWKKFSTFSAVNFTATFYFVVVFSILSVLFTQYHCCCQFCCVTIKLTELWYFLLVTSCSLFQSGSSRTSGSHAWLCICLLVKSAYCKGSWLSIGFVWEGCHGDTGSEKGTMVFHAAAVYMDVRPTAMAVRAELAGSQATCENALAHLHLTFWLWLNGVSVHWWPAVFKSASILKAEFYIKIALGDDSGEVAASLLQSHSTVMLHVLNVWEQSEKSNTGWSSLLARSPPVTSSFPKG